MLTSLVLSYFLTANEPMFLRTNVPVYYDSRLMLVVHKDIGTRYYVDVNPYVYRSIQSGITGRAGAKAAVGVHIHSVDIEVQHESIHSLDVATPNPGAIELDNINLVLHLN